MLFLHTILKLSLDGVTWYFKRITEKKARPVV